MDGLELTGLSPRIRRTFPSEKLRSFGPYDLTGFRPATRSFGEKLWDAVGILPTDARA